MKLTIAIVLGVVVEHLWATKVKYDTDGVLYSEGKDSAHVWAFALVALGALGGGVASLLSLTL